MRTIAVTVYSSRKEPGPPDDLGELISFLQSKLEEIPEAHRPTAGYGVTGDDEYGRLYEVVYYRPETPEEQSARLKEEAERRSRRSVSVVVPPGISNADLQSLVQREIDRNYPS